MDINLARTFLAEVDSLLKSHRKAMQRDGKELSESYYSRATEVFTSTELRLSQIVDHHFDPATGVEYALATLNLDAYRSTIDALKELPDELKQELEASAKAAFDELHERKAAAKAGKP